MRSLLYALTVLSLPMRGAWIEIDLPSYQEAQNGRSPCGERGLKYDVREVPPIISGRSPCGERGLKYTIGNVTFKSCASLPLRGAWIEIL